ncbi:MATE family efflux transporter [Alteriqipengyuania sp. 357]
MSKQAKLTRGSIPGHLVTQTLPMIIGVAAIMSISLIDAYFIGQLGPDPLAAISFIFPISVALTSLGVGVMVGINSVVARSLGAGDHDQAARRANLGVVFATVVGVVLGIALWLLQEPLFRLMNAPDNLLPLIRDYMDPFALAFPFSLVLMGFNGVLRGQGEAKMSSFINIAYAAVNWVLDPLLITGAFGIEGFGIAGAAYATLVGWAIAVVLAVVCVGRTHLPFNPALIRDCENPREPIVAIMKVAGPASFSNAINPIGLSVLTALIALEGQSAVAAFGAAGRLQSFAIVPLLALSGSIGAIVGQNWGANLPERSRAAARGAGLFSVIYGLVVAVALVAAAKWFAGFFTDDPAIVRQFSRYLEIAAWGYAGFGLLIVGNGILNAVDKAGLALAQSCARVFLVMLPFGWLLRPLWDSDAIYAAELAANVIGGLVAVVLVRKVLNGEPKNAPHAEKTAEPATAS